MICDKKKSYTKNSFPNNQGKGPQDASCTHSQDAPLGVYSICAAFKSDSHVFPPVILRSTVSSDEFMNICTHEKNIQ